ncbi:MAG: diacylglycerol/lipid kinase family protein, partial [Flammeovirgaceae bacterium]
QSFGNEIFIAPDAKVDDGQFNLFVGGNVPLLKFLWYLQTIKGKRKVSAPQVHYAMGSEIKLSSTKSAMLEADGELVGWLPAKVRIRSNWVFFFR